MKRSGAPTREARAPSAVLVRVGAHLLSPAWDRIRSGLLLPAWRLVGRRHLVPAYRRALLRRLTVVAVTGSAGKTTAKELIAAVLATSLRGRKTPVNENLPRHIAKAMLHARPWDDFFVAEVAAAIRGERVPLEEPLRLLRPSVAVVTTVGFEHAGAFDSVEAVAAEKGKLVAALPPGGTAVLNADDPRVLAMAALCPGRRVLTYGTASAATLRAADVRSAWPDRLSFTLVHAGRSYPVRTQFCGTHFVSSVLAALAVGVALDVPLERAVEAVGTVAPFPVRMSPRTSPDGVTFVRDDAKAPLWSLDLAFQFMRDARAPRRIIVVGSLSDYLGNSGRKYVAVARRALEAADAVVFVGPNAPKVLPAKSHPRGDALHAVLSVDAARELLGRLLRPGDIVLLKGSDRDQLGRLVGTRVIAPATGPAPAAGGEPAGAAAAVGSDPAGATAAAGRERGVCIVVGLGNPGPAYERTPHNVGYRVLDLLADALGATFRTDDQALVARAELAGTTCYLVKAQTLVNTTGPIVRRLAERVGAGREHCIVVQDDIALPPGAVRTRLSGSDGGHRGVRSLLEAFGSHAIRRVKIGVGRPPPSRAVARHVVGEIPPAEWDVIARACEEAVAHVRALAGPAGRARMTA